MSETDRHVTLVCDGTMVFGQLAVTYAVRAAQNRSRILVKLAYRNQPRSLLHWLLPIGDRIMMRKQLLTLEALAEHEYAST